MFGHEAEQERGGAVRRAVVDDDHAERRVRLGQRAAHDVRDDVGAVEGRDDDVVGRERHGGQLGPARPAAQGGRAWEEGRPAAAGLT